VGLLSFDPQRDLPFRRVANHEDLFDVVGEDLQRQLPFLHPSLPALQEATPASLHRAEHAFHDRPQMVDSQPTLWVMFAGPERDDPSGPASGPTGRIRVEAEVRHPVFVGHQLAVDPGGVRLVTQDLVHFGEVLDEACELLGIMPVPSGGGEPVHHPGVHIDADVQFDAVPPAPVAFDAQVVPGAALVRVEPGAVDRDRHLPPAEEPDNQVHRLPDVGDGEAGHASLDDAVPGEHRAAGGEALAVFYVGLDTVIGLVEPYFQEASDGDGPGVVSFPSSFLGLPGWWQPVHRLGHRPGEQGSEVAVHMVRNDRVNPFLCVSHPAKNKALPP